MSTRRGTMMAAATALLAAAAVGCATTPVSRELVDARKAVQEARGGLAGELEPDELRRAQRMLQRAEAADDGSDREQYLAYLADRRARVAMANARRHHVTNQLASVQEAYRRDLEAAAIAGAGHEEREMELAEAREARLEAERRAARAIGRLEELAHIRNERNETIITMSGEVLFESGRSELLPTARQRLQAVANALSLQPQRRIRIEGHTDSRGSSDSNEQLSRARAEAVRRFLIDQGIDPNRVQALGRGESRPIAENDSPEGRANNRRVEIVLEPAPTSTMVRDVVPAEGETESPPSHTR